MVVIEALDRLLKRKIRACELGVCFREPFAIESAMAFGGMNGYALDV